MDQDLKSGGTVGQEAGQSASFARTTAMTPGLVRRAEILDRVRMMSEERPLSYNTPPVRAPNAY